MIFTGINLLLSMTQISGEAWVLTLFSGEGKAQSASFLGTGQIFGVILGYNVFTPLNDTQWLNDNFYSDTPRKVPLVTHAAFCSVLSVLLFVQASVTLLFIAEEVLKDKKAKEICKIMAVIPRHVTNPNMLGFICYLFATRFVYYMVDLAYDLQLVRNGYLNLGRSTLPIPSRS